MHNNTKNKKLRFIINLTLDSRKGKKPPSSTHQADIHFPCPQAIYQDRHVRRFDHRTRHASVSQPQGWWNLSNWTRLERRELEERSRVLTVRSVRFETPRYMRVTGKWLHSAWLAPISRLAPQKNKYSNFSVSKAQPLGNVRISRKRFLDWLIWKDENHLTVNINDPDY